MVAGLMEGAECCSEGPKAGAAGSPTEHSLFAAEQRTWHNQKQHETLLPPPTPCLSGSWGATGTRSADQDFPLGQITQHPGLRVLGASHPAAFLKLVPKGEGDLAGPAPTWGG